MTLKKFIASIILMLALSQFLIGQNLNKKIIDKEFGLTTNENVFYVINGIPYKGVEVDSALNLYPNNHLVELTILKNDAKTFFCTNNETILIVFAHQQQKKEIRKTLKELKNKFSDNYSLANHDIPIDVKNPVLYINNTLIKFSKAKEEFEKLAISDIYFIDYKNEPQNTELSGQNAKNGLVRIWTKNK